MNPEPCRYFRSKVMFVPAQENAPHSEAERQGAGYCWCNLSMCQIGHDDQLVGYAECSRPERRCYEI